MSHSVVKVTDSIENDSLLLLVGEDGTVTPDKETVKSFLNSKTGSTNIQLMHINKSDGKSIDVSIDNLMYVPDNDVEEVTVKSSERDMDQLAHNLYCIRLDHDYTPLTSPKRPDPPAVDDDLAQTLGILEGTIDTEPPELVIPPTPIKTTKIVKTVPKQVILKPASAPSTPVSTPTPTPVHTPTPTPSSVSTPLKTPVSTPVSTTFATPTASTAKTPVSVTTVMPTPPPPISIPPSTKTKPKIVTMQKQAKPVVRQTRSKPKIVEEIEEEVDDDDDDDFESLDDFDFDYADDDNDSDFEIVEAQKPKVLKKSKKKQKKHETPRSVKPAKVTPPKPKVEKPEPEPELEPEPEPPKIEKPPEQPPPEQKAQQTAEQKPLEKKPPKKEKKPPKPIPDDFALFSTPDIIRRVGGKEPTTPNTPITPTPGASSIPSSAENTSVKPAKITQENRSKSTPETIHSPTKSNRLSLDSKVGQTEKEKHSSSHHRSNSESKHKDRRPSSDARVKRHSTDENRTHRHSEKSHPEHRKSTEHSSSIKNSLSSHNHHSSSCDTNTDTMASMSATDLNDIMLNDPKPFSSSLPMDVTPDLHSSEQQSLDQSNINLENSGLDLDQSILDNINNDLISEDILYQVAQSLVNNTELQNAIDKSINEGNLVLDPAIQQAMQDQNTSVQPEPPPMQKHLATEMPPKGTQIIRPDGRIVVIPPIERPTTRSRNKKKEEEKPVFKPSHKPLDDEHVSGNELDSSGEEEDESEDDPNKLWCICNRPHNNRFMICCDTCEEWYHGKCVNITKSMGQQMEAEGKEWICLFCKDSSLKRPQAAARRIRKASRASRASSDSTGSSKKGSSDSGNTGSVPCVVCQKPARKNSIFCSESCILAHAQGVEKVVVFERATGTMLTGNKAPTAANLEQWLRDHPGFEVVRSTGKMVSAKPSQLTQSKLKLVKNPNNEGVSLAVQKKGVNVGVLKHSPKNQSHQQLQQHHQQSKLPGKGQITGVKIISKHINTGQQKTTKLVQPQPLPASKTPTSPGPVTPKSKQVKTPKTPSSEKKAATPKEKSTPTPNKDKPMPIKTPKARQAETTPPPKQQENIRENVQKTLFEQLTNRLKMADDLKVSEEDLKNISNEIESQLFKCFGDTGQKYRNKYRSLIFNIKDVKNQTLWRRICEKSINPYQLVRLSSDDLASQELALWREREAKHQLDMIKKSELELLNCNRQYVLKTHKGEQILEDNRPTDCIENTEVITSLTEGSKSDTTDAKHENKDKDKRSSSKHRHKDRDRERKSSRDKSDSKDSRSRRSSSRDRDRSRRRSRSRDRSSRHKKRSRSKERDRDRHRHSSHKSSKHKRDSHNNSNSTTDKLDKKSKEILEQLVDNKIVPPLEDRLWKHVPQDDILPASMESDSDHEPSSTVTIPTPPRSSDQEDFSIDAKKEGEVEEERSTSPPLRRPPEEIWRGTISMIDVAQICITAHEVSGDCAGLGTELPPNLEIVGRISPDTVWDYIRKMRCSNSKIISLVRLNAINIEEKMPYLALYSYLSSRNRLGVVKSTNKAVKDFYILPLASQKPIPQALLPLNGPGFEESRPALLLGIIVRDKRKRPLLDPVPVPVASTKRVRGETPPLPTHSTLPARSYTPPPSKDPRLKLPLPPVLVPVPPVAAADDPIIKGDEDEPYSPEDSDPDSSTITADISTLTPSVPSTKYIGSSTPPRPFPTYTPKIPVLDVAGALPASTQDLETHLAEINKKIAESKSEINSISQNLASTDIGSSALANIALPSNLQQILDSIKTIVPTSESEAVPGPSEPAKDTAEGNLTIPLMLPNKFSRPLNAPPVVDLTSDTIPLNLPKVKKTSRVSSPLPSESDKTSSVLSSLSEEDLIRKAAEMLGENSDSVKRGETSESKMQTSVPDTSVLSPLLGGVGSRPTIVKTLQPDTHGPKRVKIDLNQPPIPGLESEML